MRVWPGRPAPLGATWDGEGVNFALFSADARQVELCLFDRADDVTESERIPLRERSNSVWYTYLPDVRPGQLYGYRVQGEYAPARGLRFRREKLLVDPYAKAVCEARWDDALFGYVLGDEREDLSASTLDSGAFAPKCMVVDGTFAWGRDAPPRTPWNRTLVYECHVRGMTMLHSDVPAELRGTYLGLASDAVLDHLKSIGVTAVELLPVHASIDAHHLVERGLCNYWGYDSLGFFAPSSRYATAGGDAVSEFKSMVKALHREGIEVLLDVVYNHSGEGNRLGPTVAFRGIDNRSYYRLSPRDPRYYVDYTGCGNTLDLRHPRVMQLVLDSLRYWVQEMHVDGFRFDLAPALAREPEQFDPQAKFFTIVQQDPVLSSVKLISEPWDLGPDGYSLGRFPAGWSEWNAAYRDCGRRFWRGDEGKMAELASRLAGSSDIFQHSDRGPYASINFITCHDGFTLRDLVSYEHKHNEANGEENRDGTDANYSRNWGAEGPSTSVRIQRARDRARRNLIATLAFSQGVPMLAHGDELGRTQRGNNNAYCQDNELAWVDWQIDDRQREFLEFVRLAFRIRRENPVFRRRSYFRGNSGDGDSDVHWIGADGVPLDAATWSDPSSRVLGMLMPGSAADEVDERGRPMRGRTLLLLLNGGARSRFFAFPGLQGPGRWREELNTARTGRRIFEGEGVHLAAHSLMLLGHEGRS